MQNIDIILTLAAKYIRGGLFVKAKKTESQKRLPNGEKTVITSREISGKNI